MRLSRTIRAHIYQSPAAAELDMTAVMDDGRKHGLMGVTTGGQQLHLIRFESDTRELNISCSESHYSHTETDESVHRKNVRGSVLLHLMPKIPANREQSVLARFS